MGNFHRMPDAYFAMSKALDSLVRCLFLLDAFMRRMGPIDQQARSLLKSVSQNRQS